jgi:hypothetical protein
MITEGDMNMSLNSRNFKVIGILLIITSMMVSAIPNGVRAHEADNLVQQTNNDSQTEYVQTLYPSNIDSVINRYDFSIQSSDYGLYPLEFNIQLKSYYFWIYFFYYRASLVYDISCIPDEAEITNVGFGFHILNDDYYDTYYIYLDQMSVDPLTATAEEIWYDTGDGINYASVTSPSTIPSDVLIDSLGAQAVTDLQASLADDCFAIGMRSSLEDLARMVVVNTPLIYITYTLQNEPPTADAGDDQVSILGGLTHLDGSGSYDNDGTIESYTWDLGDTNTVTGVIVDHQYLVEGTYTLTLTVTDDYGATDTDTISVTVLTPEQAVQSLIGDLEALNLADGIETSFISKLDNSIKSIINDRPAASGQISAFINEVEAQRGKELTEEQADYLIGFAQRLVEVL